MLKIKDYYNAINKFAPFSLAESWDNVGLLVGNMEDQAFNVLLALDVTSKVIDEAIEKNIDLIITHHPLIFNPIKQLDSNSLVYRLAQHGIGLISAHTNLDIAKGGVNDALANALGLSNLQPLNITGKETYYTFSVYVPESYSEAVYEAISNAGAGKYDHYSGSGFVSCGEGRFIPDNNAKPAIGKANQLEHVKEEKLEMIVSEKDVSNVISAMKRAHPYEEPGYNLFVNHGINKVNSLGYIGELKTPMTSREFAEHVKKQLNAAWVNFAPSDRPIKTVGFCGGSGDNFITQAIDMGVDAYLSGEIAHNYILEGNEAGITTVIAGHFATENIVMEPLKTKLEGLINNSKITISQVCTDEVISI